MSEVIFKNSGKPLSGNVILPCSKSAAHRAILCAALAGKDCVLSNFYMNKDMEATLRAVSCLGNVSYIYLKQDKKLILKKEQDIQRNDAAVNCGESGSTLRFVIPIFAALGVPATFTGKGRLPGRPIGIYETLLKKHDVSVKAEGGLPFSITGKLSGGVYALPGNISSQFITGLLFALPLCSENSEIQLTSRLESKGYIDLTISVLKDFGIGIQEMPNGYKIEGNQRYIARDFAVEGDWSHAAFFLSIAAVSGGEICLSGLKEDSLQGDRACAELYGNFGVEIKFENGVLTVRNPNTDKPYRGLKAQKIDGAQIPDLIPALAVCGAFAEGTTEIYNAERLRIKESDRLAAMAAAIHALGGIVEETRDGLRITGVQNLSGGQANGENDHRILMSLSAAVCGSMGDIIVSDAESVEKSYPHYYKDYKKLGGTADVVNMG
jgi:3-phosphoshikimate 1-carboxyvinyltransferase